MRPTSPPTALKPKHWLLAQSCQWHKWGGLIAALFLLVVGATGIVLNYKQPIFSVLGLEKPLPKPETPQSARQTALLTPTTGTGLAAMPVSVERALQIALDEWGDVPLERIELRSEHGQMIYKLKQRGGSELWVTATDGSHFIKGQYERFAKAGADGAPVRKTDWGKILIDLHTGKMGGEVGRAVMTFAAGLLLLLTVSGVYMWIKPLWIRHQKVRAKTYPPAPVKVVAAKAGSVHAPERELAEV